MDGFELKATIRDIKPAIWRTLRVPEWVTVEQLHRVMQGAFGWNDSHMHDWRLGRLQLRPKTLRLSDLELQPGVKLLYFYDFGDSWEVDVKVTKLVDDAPAVECLAGARAGPPDDCGGVPGYLELLGAFARPTAPESRELLDWVDEYVGPGWAPDRVDLNAINKALAKLREKPQTRKRPLSPVTRMNLHFWSRK